MRSISWQMTAAAWALAAAIVLSAVDAGAMQTVVVVETMPVPVVLEHSRWFQDEMRRLGYTHGNTMNLITIEAHGSREVAESELKAAIARGRPDLVVTFATLASQAAHRVCRGTGIPVLFAVVSDPVGAGLVEATHRPTGTHVTGRVYTHFRTVKLDLVRELARQAVPGRPVRIGCIHSSYPSAQGDIRRLSTLADARDDIVFVGHEVPYREMPAGLDTMLADVAAVIEKLADEVDFWWQPAGPLGEVMPYTKVLLGSRVPIIYGNTVASVRAGALLTVTPNFEHGGREVARLADAILNGTDPGAIPVTAPEAFDVAVNLGTALRLGIVVPPATLSMAGQRVYR